MTTAYGIAHATAAAAVVAEHRTCANAAFAFAESGVVVDLTAEAYAKATAAACSSGVVLRCAAAAAPGAPTATYNPGLCVPHTGRRLPGTRGTLAHSQACTRWLRCRVADVRLL